MGKNIVLDIDATLVHTHGDDDEFFCLSAFKFEVLNSLCTVVQESRLESGVFPRPGDNFCTIHGANTLFILNDDIVNIACFEQSSVNQQ